MARNPDFKEFNGEMKFTFNAEKLIDLTYENFNTQEALKRLLPAGVEIVGGFEQIGDIAHLNLNEGQMPHKNTIGQVILDKNPCLKKVVTKIGHIDAVYRYYNLECIGGDSSNFETVHVEDKVRFNLDISRVYWCSKLATERSRMISDYLKDGQVLCDMFCGVGPQAVKAAVKRPKLRVLANDLNPVGVEYLKKNIKLNKIKDRVLPFNMDAR